MLDDIPVAANIGLVSRTSVSIGVFGYSPFFGVNSPGRIHILLLGQYLGDCGFRQLDLTSGGESYKALMADRTEQIYVLSIHFHLFNHARQTVKAALLTLLKRLLSRKGISIAVKAKDLFSNPVDYLKTIADRMALLRHGKFTKCRYEIDITGARLLPSKPNFRVNSISDLLLYKPSRKLDLSRRAFLDYAWRRLESGDCVYTYSEDGMLMYCAWLRQPTKDDSSNSHSRAALLPNACLLWDSYTHPAADKRELMSASLSQRIQDSAKIPGIEKVLVEFETVDFDIQSYINRLISTSNITTERLTENSRNASCGRIPAGKGSSIGSKRD